MNSEDLEYYIKKYKEHEALRTSTNDRNKHWNEYRRSKETSRDK